MGNDDDDDDDEGEEQEQNRDTNAHDGAEGLRLFGGLIADRSRQVHRRDVKRKGQDGPEEWPNKRNGSSRGFVQAKFGHKAPQP